MSENQRIELEWYHVLLWCSVIFLVIVIALSIFVWNPESEKQKEEVRNMSCKELQAYILHPKGHSDVAKDVYMVNCI